MSLRRLPLRWLVPAERLRGSLPDGLSYATQKGLKYACAPAAPPLARFILVGPRNSRDGLVAFTCTGRFALQIEKTSDFSCQKFCTC